LEAQIQPWKLKSSPGISNQAGQLFCISTARNIERAGNAPAKASHAEVKGLERKLDSANARGTRATTTKYNHARNDDKITASNNKQQSAKQQHIATKSPNTISQQARANTRRHKPKTLYAA